MLPRICYDKEALLLFFTLFFLSEVVSSHQHEMLSITYCRQGYHCLRFVCVASLDTNACLVLFLMIIVPHLHRPLRVTVICHHPVHCVCSLSISLDHAV